MAHAPALMGVAGEAAGASSALDLAVAAWVWRPEVALPLVTLAGAYAVGSWRLARRGGPASPWRIVAAAAGFASLAVALLSPLDRVADTTFAGHMVQHLLLIAVAAPALLLADPFARLLWAFPASFRAEAGRVLRPGRWPRRLGAVLTAMPVAWLLHVTAIWLWHFPFAYDAALGDRLLHDLEHLAFFGTAILFWWPLVRPAPRLRSPAPYGLRMMYLILTAFQSAALGLVLASSPEAWYRAYASTAVAWGLTPVEDQALGGVIMWGVGGAIDMVAVIVLLARYLATEDPEAPAVAADIRGAGAPLRRGRG
jgi:putative membrane protein